MRISEQGESAMSSLRARVQYLGGRDRLQRINQQKLRSLQIALRNDYNSRMIKTPNKAAVPCLINSMNLKPDYDKKYISIEFEHQLEAGDVFEILDDGSHWMVYLPVLTETAYFRSEIIRCRYTLDIDGEDYWIYFQGPTETDLRWGMKRSINFNELNLSGTIYIKKTPATKDYFKRFTHLKIDGHIWEVQVVDSISVPGIIELEIQEYYDNPIEELPEIIQKDKSFESIIGTDHVDQNQIVGFMIQNDFYKEGLSLKIEGNERVRIEEILDGGRICRVKVYPGAIRTFDISYGDHKKTVKINLPQEQIDGKKVVYPYDIEEYKLKNQKGIFTIDTSLAKIIESTDSSCVIEIISSKKGSFVLHCQTEDQETIEFPIEIKSF